jgi:hypothetical protein
MNRVGPVSTEGIMLKVHAEDVDSAAAANHAAIMSTVSDKPQHVP